MSARNLGVFLRVFVLMIVAILLFFNQKKTKKVKEKLKQFTFLEFNIFFDKLLNHKLESHFVGVASNKINCIYFDAVESKINFEYEVLSKEQLAYTEKIIQYSKDKNFEVIKTTYSNVYISNNEELEAPVYQIKSNLNKQNAIIISKEIFVKIFNCDENTRFEIIS